MSNKPLTTKDIAVIAKKSVNKIVKRPRKVLRKIPKADIDVSVAYRKYRFMKFKNDDNLYITANGYPVRTLDGIKWAVIALLEEYVSKLDDYDKGYKRGCLDGSLEAYTRFKRI